MIFQANAQCFGLTAQTGRAPRPAYLKCGFLTRRRNLRGKGRDARPQGPISSVNGHDNACEADIALALTRTPKIHE